MIPENTSRKLATVAAGILLVAYCSVPVLADDTEIFIGQGALASPEAKPNILFVIDTSGSMGDRVRTQAPYNPATAYGGACTDNTRIYWSTDSTIPTCDAANNNWIDLSALKCQAAITAFAGASGYFSGFAARYEDRSANASYRNWVNFAGNDAPTHAQLVECQADRGVHGDGVDTTNLYARNTDPNKWGVALNEINWGARTRYTLYTPNYINWSNDTATVLLPKLDIVKDVTTALVGSITDVNVGLMRFSGNAQGGMVLHAVEDVASSRAAINGEIAGLTAAGNTPLSETLYEAGLYFWGGTVDYGDRSNPSVSVPASRQAADTTKYKSPIEYSCQNNYIVYLTDGLPTGDTDANVKIDPLVPGTCPNVDGVCLDDMAEYLFQNDLSPLPGDQNVITHTVGFATNFPLLLQTATKGGGTYNVANDTASLTAAFNAIVQGILDTSTTFAAPTVAVNAFNRTQNLNDLFITVFEPTDSLRWPGNLKKYRLDPTTGAIEDFHGNNAVDSATGFFRSSAQSFWSAGTDGATVSAGGAANELPPPATRNVYTYYSGSGSTNLINAANALSTGNAAITDVMLDVNTAGRPARDDVINWARGQDVQDADTDGDPNEARNQMGDPLHSRPATVIYGGTVGSPSVNDAVVIAATNEGYVHAIDPSTGTELWSFVPDVMLPKLYQVYQNPPSSTKFYGIDGNMQMLKVDHNNNGIIEPANNDRVYLFFGMRRGGNFYYALNITDKTSPEFLWKLSPAELPGLAQTWSTPAVARVDVGSPASQTDPDDYVLIFGGGYEVDQDPNSTTFMTSYSTDTTGNRVFMVDATTGARLWYAGGVAGADLALDGSSGKPTMNNSIPGDIRVIDLDNNGYVDRMYAGDMGGRVWRFDITNGNAPNALVAGGIFASLGNADSGSHPAVSTRRFYYAPDVALIRSGALTFLNLAIGSGYRASPLNEEVDDRLYSLRDTNVFNKLTQANYNSLVSITDADPIDVTADITTPVPPTAKGWKINLTRDGEKVLAEARTFQNRIFFTTYTPYDGVTVNPCVPAQGSNRLYIVNALDGDPALNRDNPSMPPDEVDDRVMDLAQGGIAPEAVFLFPTPDPGCTGNACKPPPQCLVGLENCGVNLTNNPVRTFWTQQNIDAN